MQLIQPVSPKGSDKTLHRHFVTWTEKVRRDEDEILGQAVQLHGTEKWSLIAALFQNKTGRQCRRRWHTYLSTACKKGGWSPEEDQILLEAQRKYGNRWTEIAKIVPGRTDNAVKNRFCALLKKQAKDVDANSSQSSGGDVEDRVIKRKRILEENKDILNKRIRNEEIQHRQHPVQPKNVDAVEIMDKSFNKRNHPLRYSLSPSTMASQPLLSNQDGGKRTAPIAHSRSPSSSRWVALNQNAELLDSLVERRNAKLRYGNALEEAWKDFDWINSKNIICKNMGSNSLRMVNQENVYSCRGKENYPSLAQTLSNCERQRISNTSLKTIVNGSQHAQKNNTLSEAMLVLNNEKQWGEKIFSEAPPARIGLNSANNYNVDNHLSLLLHGNSLLLPIIQDSTQTSTTQPSNSCHELLMDVNHQAKESLPIASCNELSELFGEAKVVESPLFGTASFGDMNMASPLHTISNTPFLIDGLPSPQFSDSERQFLLSALDVGCQVPDLDSPPPMSTTENSQNASLNSFILQWSKPSFIFDH